MPDRGERRIAHAQVPGAVLHGVRTLADALLSRGRSRTGEVKHESGGWKEPVLHPWVTMSEEHVATAEGRGTASPPAAHTRRDVAQPGRRSALLLNIPRQGGAWSVLLSAFVLGVAASGGMGRPGMLLLAAATFGFLARHTAGLWARPSPAGERKGEFLRWAVGYSLAAVLLGAVLAGWYQRWILVPLGLLAAAFAVASVMLERRRKERTVLGELVGVAGLTIVVPAAAYCATALFGVRTLGLWALAALFFGGSVFHVRYLVRNRSARAGPLAARVRAGMPSLAYHSAALAAAAGLAAVGAVPAMAYLAILPAVARAFWGVLQRSDKQPRIRRVGYAEVVHTVVFVVATAFFFRASVFGQ